MSEAHWLDGNALAGLLHQLFGTELTSTPRGCQSCGSVRPIAEHRLYLGAGMVLRCPVCSDVALQIARLPDRHVVKFTGTWQLEIVESPAIRP
jgi:hypothetical protein